MVKRGIGPAAGKKPPGTELPFFIWFEAAFELKCISVVKRPVTPVFVKVPISGSEIRCAEETIKLLC